METLKEIKEALNKIPDEVLGKCQWGIGENSEEKVGLIYLDDDYAEIFEKYDDLVKIDNLVENVKKAQTIMDNQDKAEELSEELQQNGVTDTYFDKKEELKFFKCYRSEVSCIDCEFKEPCNVFVYVKQQVELDTPSFKKEREKTKEKAKYIISY